MGGWRAVQPREEGALFVLLGQFIQKGKVPEFACRGCQLVGGWDAVQPMTKGTSCSVGPDSDIRGWVDCSGSYGFPRELCGGRREIFGNA